MKLLTALSGLIGAAAAIRLDLYAKTNFEDLIESITEEPTWQGGVHRELPRVAHSYKFDDEGKRLLFTGFNSKEPWYGIQQCGSGQLEDVSPNKPIDIVNIEIGNGLNGC